MHACKMMFCLGIARFKTIFLLFFFTDPTPGFYGQLFRPDSLDPASLKTDKEI